MANNTYTIGDGNISNLRYKVLSEQAVVRTFVVGASSNLGQLFLPRQKHWGLGWEERRLSRYIRTVIARVKIWANGFATFLLGE